MIVRLTIAFVVPALMSLILTPYVSRLAKRIGAIDQPNERKVHVRPIPRLGGVGIFLSFLLSLVIFLLVDPTQDLSSWATSHAGVMLILSLLLVLLLGIWDDLQSLRPGQKFIVQLIAASIAYIAGFRISSVTHPLGAQPLVLGALDFPATVLWIVGVSNAFNLIDGLDGLATGVALIASLSVGAIAYLHGDLATTIPILILAGALFGFLRYNFNPARIFLGDSGSLFIGFALATLSIQSSTKGSTAFAILVPVLSLGLPIMDTLLAMIRRFLGSLLPDRLRESSFGHKLKGMFLPDRRHVHHQLLALGLSHRSAVLILYCVSCLFGIGAFAVTLCNNTEASVILVAVAVSIVAGVRKLRYHEMAIFRNGVLLSMYDGSNAPRAIFQSFIDLGFCALAFTASAFVMVHSADQDGSHKYILPALTAVCGVQVACFTLFGLYRTTFRYLGVADLLKIVETVAIAVVASGVTLMLTPVVSHLVVLPVFIADFYFLLSLVVGSRCSFHILNFLFRRHSGGAKNVLIYGADAKGVLALQQILQEQDQEYSPLGFLDDAPTMEGKRVSGYPVFGGHWKLPQIIRKYKVELILISDGNILPEAFSRLMKIAEKKGIGVRRSRILLEEVRADLPRRHAYRSSTVEARAFGQMAEQTVSGNHAG